MKMARFAFIALAAFMLTATASPYAFAQAPDTQAPAQAQTQTAKGELLQVDTEKMTLSIKSADGAELDFAYNSQTEIIGAQKGVQGLATAAGSKVTVSYTMSGETKTATKVEVQPSTK
jgi:hypothetical protein